MPKALVPPPGPNNPFDTIAPRDFVRRWGGTGVPSALAIVVACWMPWKNAALNLLRTACGLPDGPGANVAAS